MSRHCCQQATQEVAACVGEAITAALHPTLACMHRKTTTWLMPHAAGRPPGADNDNASAPGVADGSQRGDSSDGLGIGDPAVMLLKCGQGFMAAEVAWWAQVLVWWPGSRH